MHMEKETNTANDIQKKATEISCIRGRVLFEAIRVIMIICYWQLSAIRFFIHLSMAYMENCNRLAGNKYLDKEGKTHTEIVVQYHFASKIHLSHQLMLLVTSSGNNFGPISGFFDKKQYFQQGYNSVCLYRMYSAFFYEEIIFAVCAVVKSP